MSGIPGFPLADPWTAYSGGTITILPANLQANVDAPINVVADFMANFPATATDYAIEATAATGSLSTSATVVFPTVTTNPGGGYSNSTGIYTIPTAGTYFCWFVLSQSTAVGFSAGLVGLPTGYPAGGYADACDATATSGPTMGKLIKFAGGESLKVKRTSVTGTVTLNGGSFMARRIGA